MHLFFRYALYIDETRGQDRPAERPRYPDADHPIWRLRRRWAKLCDTLAKRAIFPYYVWKGRNIFATIN